MVSVAKATTLGPTGLLNASAPRRAESTSSSGLCAHCLRAADRMVLMAAVALITACAGQVDRSPRTSSPQGNAGVENRYDPVAEMQDKVSETLRPCWSIDPNGPPVIVSIDATLDPDGMVLEAEPSDSDRYRTDEAYRSAADRAIRAVRHPECQPLPFSAEDWPSWRTVTLVFNPEDVFRDD